jgi:hypothetical protein
MRQIIHAERDGKYVAIDNPGAVVVDHGAKMLRIGLERHIVHPHSHWLFMMALLEAPNQVVSYDSFPGARLSGNLARSTSAQLAGAVSPIISHLGMVLETVDREGFRLHTDPQETLECCQHLALGQPLPTRVRSTRRGLGQPLTKPAPLHSASTRVIRGPFRRLTR